MYARTFRRCSQKSDEFLVTVGRERREEEEVEEEEEEEEGRQGLRRCEGGGEGRGREGRVRAGRGPVGRRHLQYFYFNPAAASPKSLRGSARKRSRFSQVFPSPSRITTHRYFYRYTHTIRVFFPSLPPSLPLSLSHLCRDEGVLSHW